MWVNDENQGIDAQERGRISKQVEFLYPRSNIQDAFIIYIHSNFEPAIEESQSLCHLSKQWKNPNPSPPEAATEEFQSLQSQSLE